MKRIIMCIITLCAITDGFSQKNISYDIVKADMYLQGAKIYSESNTELTKGQHTILIKNISDYADLENVQVSVSSGAKLISVNKTRDFIDAKELSPRGKELTEKRDKLAQQIELLNIENEVIREEIGLIQTLITNNNDDKSGKYTAAQLQEVSSFYGTKVLELRKKSYDIELKVTKLNEELALLNAQINEEAINKNKNNQVVEIMIDVAAPGKKTIELSYFVRNYGWVPSYDIKAESKEKPIEIVYKASVWQRSGIDWKNVQVTLMTNQPVANQNRPVLWPLYANLQAPAQVRSEKSYARETVMEEESYSNMLELSMVGAGNASYDAVAYTSDINMSYQINGKITVTGDGKANILTLDSKTTNGKFIYHAVPKINEQVYLIAYISDWNKLNLINGRASIYLQDVFIGHIQINESFTGDDYPLSFGVDNRLSIKRTKSQDISSESKIGSEKREKTSFEITVRNNLGFDTEVEILDQVPVSRNKNLKINLDSYDNAEYTPDTGLLKWNLPVRSGQSASVKFNYEIRYPKENTIYYQH